MLQVSLSSVVLNRFPHHSCVCVFLQKEVPKVMKEGFDGMLQFEKRTKDKNAKVYTYENAVKRCYIFYLCCL